MKKQLILLLSLVITSMTFAQESPSPSQSFRDRVYFGGGLGLSFGTVTSVNVNPLVGYKFTDKLSGGVILQYQYTKVDDGIVDYTSNNYGGSLFARYRFIEQLYGHVEYSNVNYDLFYNNGESAGRVWVPMLLVGGGYVSQIGSRSTIFLQILFDVLQNQYSPYQSGQPIYSMGIGVGF
ncbi:MAG: hypothetical protein MK212_19400 [Saprospiraceae bacterium]|nr:hypothetical protein [Saprospiraceae bacterium]